MLCDYPELILVSDVTICGPQEVDLTAIFDAGDVKWYDSVTKDSLLHTGAVFSTQKIESDTAYFVQAGNIKQDFTGTVGDGVVSTAANWEFLYSLYEGYKHQYIFTAEELMDAGLSEGDVTALE